MPDSSTNLQGKVALVTGASRRIGAEIARTLHHAGMNLCLHYRSSAKDARLLADELSANRPDSVITIQQDLLKTGELADFVQQASTHWGRLDTLINNASTFYATPINEITDKDWDVLMGSNLKAPLFLSQAAATQLAKHQGSIINMIDIHAERPMRKHVVYSVAKSGLLALTKSLARELGPAIRVNGIAPGAILWPESDQLQSEQQTILKKTALQRAGNPTDIAKAVLFLLRDAPYVTGHVLPIDGGRLLNI